MTRKTKNNKSRKPAQNARVRQQQVGRLGTALRALGGLGGGALGSFVGAPALGASGGTSMGAALSRWLGAGDYKVATNSVVAKGSDSVPNMHKNGRSVTVSHREFIGEVKSPATPGDFAVVGKYSINPGLDQTFPWLSSVAQQFQEYDIKGMVFHYVPTSGTSTSAANPALGSVIIATNYRSTAPPFVNKVAMLNSYFSCDARPSETMAHPIECDPKDNPFNVLYTRTDAVPSGEDTKSYDLGTTYVAVQGVPVADAILGDLWVTYEIELRKPHDSVTKPQPSYSFLKGTGTNNTANTPDLLGTIILSRHLYWNGTPTWVSGLLTIPPQNHGKYIIILYSAFSGGASLLYKANTPVLGNCKLLAMNTSSTNSAFGYFQSKSTAGDVISPPEGGITQFLTVEVPYSTSASTVKLNAEVSAINGTASTGAQLYIAQINNRTDFTLF